MTDFYDEDIKPALADVGQDRVAFKEICKRSTQLVFDDFVKVGCFLPPHYENDLFING